MANLDSGTYEEIKKLVESGLYDSVDQFLRVAADNQLALEASSDDTTFDIDASGVDHSMGTKSPASQRVHLEQPSDSQFDVEDIWGYVVSDDIPVRDPFPVDRERLLLFSQYYRFLPLIFVLKELAIVTTETGGPVELGSFREHISTAVEPVRNALVHWEDTNEVKRYDRVSTGFPKADSKNPQRSMERYLDHYVGLFRLEKNVPAGFPHQLGFVSIQHEDEETTIQLTSAGVGLLQLHNPMLEHGPSVADGMLSDEERQYIVNHIRSNLGTEFKFMSFVYDTLDNVGPKYTDHLDRFETYLVQVESFTSDPTENRVRSHTAGVISRMVDLNILKRGRRRGYYEGVRPPDAVGVPTENH